MASPPARARDPVTLGIDLGTSGARAFAVAADGTVVGSGRRALAGRRAGGRHEQDPREWWTAAAAVCREALRDVGGGSVRAVATCATSGTVLLVDARGRALTAGLMHDDERAREAPRADVPAGPGLSRLRWLLEHEPAARRPGARLAHQPDVVTARLCGRPVAADSSHALKSGCDPATAAWPSALAHELGELLPELVAPGSILGTVCPDAAAATGLRAGTPVIAGMTDGCAAQIAAGALRPGDGNSVLGTTLVLKACARRRVEAPGAGVYSHRAPDGEWLAGGASSSGAGVLEASFPGRDPGELDRLAAGHERTRVLALPLPGRGERFPFVADDARAFTLGTPACDGERAAALMQGVALVERLCVERMARLGAPIDGDLAATGGASANRRWCALRAAALGRPLRLAEHGESAFGMAILAAAASSGERLAQTAGRMSRTRAVIEPAAAAGAHLDEQYARLVAELERRGWLAAGEG